MSLIASDLVSDLDLVGLDARALDDFGEATLDEKRRFAVEDWLAPAIEARGHRPETHRARRAPDACYSQISSVTADLTTAAADTTADDIPLGTIFTGGDATDALLVMLRKPYRGLYVGVEEAPNAVAAISSPVLWSGAWTGVTSLVDGTVVGSVGLAQGGPITWKRSDVWSPRIFANTFGYWSKIHVASLTSTTAARHVLPLVRSRLSYPTALYTLGLLYQGAWGSAGGDWEAKSDRLFSMAETELQKVVGMIADEFDVDQTGAVEATEVNSVLQVDDIERLTTWGRG